MQATSNLWLWLVPYIVLLLLMVYAMLEFTVSLLIKHPPHSRPPATIAKLRARILELVEEAPSSTLVENSITELEFTWQSTSETTTRFARAKQSSLQRIHILLHEESHEVRVCESASSSAFFIGWNRWLPRIRAFVGYSAGPPAMTGFLRRIMGVAHASGWTLRPVSLPFQATGRGARLLRRLTPLPLRSLSVTTLWGIVYPISYCLAFVWFFAVGGAEIRTTRNFLLFGLISAAWWGCWGLITWILCGSPRFWRGEE